MKKKILALVLCIPLYPVHLIGEWYNINTSLTSRKFNFLKETVEYWRDIIRIIKTS